MLAAVVVSFTKSHLTVELAKENRVAWFFGSTIVATYLQVFVWVHGFIHHLPHVFTYAPMLICFGWLVLFVERRTAELKDSSKMHEAESFVGFAFIMLGVLMGFSDPIIRILSFLLAGTAWIYQSLGKKHELHYWIGLTLVSLSVISVGTLEGFPQLWAPTLGLGCGDTGCKKYLLTPK